MYLCKWICDQYEVTMAIKSPPNLEITGLAGLLLLPLGYDIIPRTISCMLVYDAIYNICVFIAIIMFY